MGGFFGTISKEKCINDLYYGTDYNSHMGTKRGGMATYSPEDGFKRSIHNLENMEDFFFLDYKDYDVYELLQKYFENIYKLCEWNQFDSLAHLTYPLRYITGKHKIEVDLSRFNDIIDEILLLIVKNEKALEINTSGYFNEMKDILPNASIVKRFKELGGKYLTIGSDSHYCDKIGMGIEQGMDAALKCGFSHITVYNNRQPELIEIK